MFLWLQYHLNTNGGAVAVGAVWVYYVGCTTILILVVALKWSVQCGCVVVGAVP